MYWTTREGKKLKISEMETSHILNCIRLMDRQMVKAINKAMNRNDECYAEPPDSWVQTYQALVEEYNKRIQEEENGRVKTDRQRTCYDSKRILPLTNGRRKMW